MDVLNKDKAKVRIRATYECLETTLDKVPPLLALAFTMCIGFSLLRAFDLFCRLPIYPQDKWLIEK